MDSGRRQSPTLLLFVMAAAVPLSHTTWRVLLNNFAVEEVGFSGSDMGFLQSVREIPGLLSASIVFLLLALREQRLAILSLCLLGIGVAITGYFPTLPGMFATTLVMSAGFHYFETLQQSLTLQFVEKNQISTMLGRLASVDSLASIFTFVSVIVLLKLLQVSYTHIYIFGGVATVIVAVCAHFFFKSISHPIPQKPGWVLRKQYWLYYVLTLLAGARRQIFVVFAGFLLVTKFHYSAVEMSVLLLCNQLLTSFFAPSIGKAISAIGERRALMIEHSGLVLVFIGYAVASHPIVGAGLYMIDNLFFALAVALRSYFKQIARPEDFAGSSGVSVTINHIAAVFLPALFGLVWSHNPTWVFLSGAALAGVSLTFTFAVPRYPLPTCETVFCGRAVAAEALLPADGLR